MEEASCAPPAAEEEEAGGASLQEQLFALTQALAAFGKGKGKGGQKGKWAPWKPTEAGGEKGGGKDGDKSGWAGTGDGQFPGNCNHCDAYGHKRSQCRKPDAEMVAKDQ